MPQATMHAPGTANLTLAVATLDRPEELAACLDSIMAGSTLPAEVIVVDQSPTQSARAVVERFAGAPVPFVYLHQMKRGLSASRNAALECARYPIIAFTDDDCVPDRDWLAAIDRAFVTAPIPDAVSGRVLCYGAPAPGMYAVSLRESQTPVDYCGKNIPWAAGTGGNFAVQRVWLDRVGKFDERLGAGSPGQAAEDADLIYRLLRNGARVRYEPQVIIFHRPQPLSKRLSSRWSYGYGLGAFCGMWLRQRDLYVLYILAARVLQLSRESVRYALKREWLEVRQRVLSLRGTMLGLVYGLRQRSR